MKIVSIIGARPQFVKAGVISSSIKMYNSSSSQQKINEIILHTGQHFDSNMSENFLNEFDINPKYNLGIRESLHGKMTAKMIEGIEEILIKEHPDFLLLYGDTNSTLAGALAASKLHIPIAHIEAGLRSYNMQMPEEVNRIITDKLSNILFCPTETAVKNLKKEGIGENYQKVLNVGDVMLDAFKLYQNNYKLNANIKRILDNFDEYYLATVHRSENTDDLHRLESIFEALDLISKKTKVLIPLHPRTSKIIQKFEIKTNNIQFIEPVDYAEMITLIKNCKAVFTDSGGLQKEAYFANKVCLTLRDETEWIELVNNGFNCLTGASKNAILKAESEINPDSLDWNLNLYGDGNTGEKIVKELLEYV